MSFSNVPAWKRRQLELDLEQRRKTVREAGRPVSRREFARAATTFYEQVVKPREDAKRSEPPF